MKGFLNWGVKSLGFATAKASGVAICDGGGVEVVRVMRIGAFNLKVMVEVKDKANEGYVEGNYLDSLSSFPRKSSWLLLPGIWQNAISDYTRFSPYQSSIHAWLYRKTGTSLNF